MVTVLYEPGWKPPAPLVEFVVRHHLGPGPGEVVRFLVDSGADRTVVPDAAIARLGLDLQGLIKLKGFGGAGTALHEHRAELELTGISPPLQVLVLAGPAGLPAVLGRDVLNRYRVILDGPNQRLEIA
jgi:hypothetical protein